MRSILPVHKPLALIEAASRTISYHRAQPEAVRHRPLGAVKQRLADSPILERGIDEQLIQLPLIRLEPKHTDDAFAFCRNMERPAVGELARHTRVLTLGSVGGEDLSIALAGAQLRLALGELRDAHSSLGELFA